MNETTILLSKDSTSQDVSKKDSYNYPKKGCLVIFAVVCGLAIVFAVLMTKWHLISQSVITPTVSSHDVEFYPNEKGIDADGPPGSQQAETPRDEETIEAGPPASPQSETPDGGDGNARSYRDDGGYPDDGDVHEDRPPSGATAKQFGKAFPLTILAQIAWTDLSNMFPFGNVENHDLAQSVSMMPDYISEQDCTYAVNYFEEQTISEDKDCQYVDLNDMVFGKNECEEDNDHDESESQMSRITNKIMDYFSENYANYLMDCKIGDIRMIKYLSDGAGYSGLHAETHYIDGKRIIDSQADYVGIVFLNDNFNGGNLQFIAPKAIDSISPQIGNGVLFGGGLDYSHRVTPVTNGDRYVLKIIFNKN